MRIATYNRVSNKEQSRDKDALVRQIWQTQRSARMYGEEFLEFTDVQTGRRDDRPDFQELLKLIETKQVDRVIVTRIDRITRDLAMNAALIKLFEKTKVEIFEILLGRVIDFKNPNDWDYFARAGVKAEGESRMLGARVIQTMDWLRSQGKLAGGQPPFGYRRSPDGFIEVDPNEFDKLQDVLEIILEFDGPTADAAIAIRDRLGFTFNRSYLYKLIRNQTLRGYLVYKGEVIGRGTHPSVFDTKRMREMSALEKIDQCIEKSPRNRGRNRKNRVYQLGGLVFCSRCGSNCHIKTVTDPKRGYAHTYIMCGQRQNLLSDCGGQYGSLMGRKRTVHTPYDIADNAVVEALKERIEDIIRASVDAEVSRLSAPQGEGVETIRLKEAIARLESLNDPDLASAIAKKRGELQKLLSSESADSGQLQKKQDELLKAAKIPGFWDLTDEEKIGLYRGFVSRVECDRESVTVRLSV